MAKMLHSATMSLDGFIAGPGGDVSWLTEHLGANAQVDELIDNIDRPGRTGIKLEHLRAGETPQATSLWMSVL